MENDILFLINILNDNAYVKKVDEEFDAKVRKLLVEDSLEEEVSIEYSGDPYYIELNGFSDPSELDNFPG